MLSEREKLEFDSLPEFIREPYSSVRESYASSAPQKRSYTEEKAKMEEPSLPKSAELEALWPGVHHEFLQPSKRSPVVFLAAGFISGVAVTLLGCFMFFSVSHVGVPGIAHGAGKKIVVAGESGGSQKGSTGAPDATANNGGSGELVVPLYSSYEVKTGDTLAGIAIQAYKRASPRLLDEICKANHMRSANVLSLGQKLVLPEYRPLTSQVAASSGPTQ